MKVLGYTYSTGSVLCVRHATDTSDPGNQTGQAYDIYSTSEAHYDLVCDVAGCGIFLEKNCADGCELGGYEHFFFYEDEQASARAHTYVLSHIDADAHLFGTPDDWEIDYPYTIVFTSEEELLPKQAQALVGLLVPAAYDLNCEVDVEAIPF